MVRLKIARDKTPSKQMLLAPPKKPMVHATGNAIVEYSLHWAKVFLALEGHANKKAYKRAKQDCREAWDIRCPVEEASSVEERRALSKKRFKKDVWPFITWGMKRLLHLRDDRGFYVPRSKVDAFRHWNAAAAAAAGRDRPRPVPIVNPQHRIVVAIPGAAPPPIKQESRSPSRQESRTPIKKESCSPIKLEPRTPIKQESCSPIKLEPRSPVLLVVPPGRRGSRATPYPRNKTRAPRSIKKESVTPGPLLPKSPIPASPAELSDIPDTPTRPCNGKPFRRLFSVDTNTQDVPLRDAQVSPIRRGIRTLLPRWDMDDEDFPYNDCDMFGA
ncbi:hypothetical protein CYLTODRAFT_458891 [Cylindrobasidium torrendii FP15055 ss-10]|uniref:Uncharacterized protein n=1 Tax=Cylindrobasidium torrendii FP15055 ss-10 TaxID=1314674 RepID=A0A0D7AXF1_9AGAR|nr:hypothetical protein CYLTODRAFT_458891 [Cylindrobasidium torrendii FP15055 ss-10]